jgi:adenosylcobyric acid synthase
MALNSFITDEGLEMGRAQVVQAEACGIEPSVRMNPILLKPVTHVGSQVIVNGEVLGNMSAEEYYARKQTLRPVVQSAYDSLAAEYDVVVLEGAGSPAEINLRQDDFVNMGMAKMAGAPVLLVGDIDRGGVFAQLYGTVALLDGEDRRLVKATVINKFRGDKRLLTPGLTELEKLTGVPVAGVIPFLPVDIDDEDSLAERLARKAAGAVLNIAVIRLPHLSNFTDFTALEATPGVAVRYIRTPGELGSPDMLILPGTKSTIADLSWLREQGFEAPVKRLAAAGTVVFGICGGYQMLGRRIVDAEGSEGGGDTAGFGLLPVQTEFAAAKHRSRVRARVQHVGGALGRLAGTTVEGYEIHMGRTTLAEGARPFLQLESGAPDGCALGSVYGSYLHGFFDAAPCREAVLKALGEKKGIALEPEAFDLKAYKERQYDLLAEGMRKSLDMELVYRILREGV